VLARPSERAWHSPRASWRALIALLAVGAAIGGLCSLREARRDMALAADITTPDSVVVAAALRARQTGHLYPLWSAPPYTPTPYGPVYYGAVMALSEITGTHFARLVIAARLFTLLCFLGVIALAGACCRRLEAGLGWAALAAALAASDLGFAHWNLTTRPDMTALLASLAAVWAASGLRNGAGALKREIGVSLLLAAAVLSKQSYIAAPLAIAIWLAAQREWARLARIASAALGTTAVVLGALAAHGDRVAANLLALRGARPAVATGIGIVLRSLEDYAPHTLLLALAAVGLAAAWRASGPGRPARLLALYAMLAWLLGIGMLLANSGGGENYLIEGWAISAVFAAYAVATLSRQWAQTPAAARALLVIWVAVCMGAGVVAWHHEAFTAQPAGHGKLAKAVHGWRVLSDVPYLALQGRDPAYLDPYLLHTLEVNGRWSSRQLARSLAAQRFDVLLLDDGTGAVNTVWRGLSHYDAATMAAIAAHYRPSCASYPVIAFLPTPVPAGALARLEAAGCRPLGSLKINPAQP